jgi:tRNA(Ile)-lysidine synthetase-like protein
VLPAESPRQVSSDPVACLQRAAALAIPAGGKVLLAVSGGSDSVALMAAAREVLASDLLVVHVRHGLRADDDRDARLVQALCAGLDLPCRVLHAPPDGAAGSAGRSETAARRRRLQALEREARASGCAAVLSAHHGDDVRETMLLNLRRGHGGARALAGIPTVRRLGPAAVLLRPFVLGPRPPGRRDLAQLREGRGLPCVVDPTNADTRIPRNAVRAWLAGCDAAFLLRLDRVRRAARAGLAQQVTGAALALERGLHAEGHGASVARAAFLYEEPDADAHAHRSELLRLLGACLARPRRSDPRGAVLDALARALEAGRGRVRVPAQPQPFELRCSAEAVHLPSEALGALPVPALVLAAVSAGSLHL